MLRLAPVEPEWHTLFPAIGDQPAVEVLFAPITMLEVRAARRAVRLALDLDSEDMVAAGDALSAELIRRGVRNWRGVGDLAGNALDPANPVHVAAFVNDHRTFEAADTAYVIPWMQRDQEGNGWSASPSGTGEAETKGIDTASSPAEPATADDAGQPATASDAPTASTSRRRKKG